MPTMWKMTQTRIARNTGSAMRAFTGIWTTGMTSQMLQTKMKLNSVSRNGVHAQAARAHRLQDDAVADEVDDRLGDVLHARRHELLLAAGDEEEAEHDHAPTATSAARPC